jgi:predicted metal-dependent hydrolase
MRNPLQLVLDFLSPPRETAQSPFDKTQVTPASVTPPKSGVSRSLVHPSTQVELPGEVSIAHPRANRETVLEGMRVAYLFQRVRRRSIGFVVGPDGLEVRAPKWVTLKEVELGLQERGEWVLRKPIHLHLSPQNGRSELNEQGQLLLALPHSAEASQIRDAVQAWLMREAKMLFEQRLNHFAPLMGVQWRRLSLSNAGSRWGSARIDGAIRLNWRLIHLKPEAIDYVVVHELAHLHEMNHSPAFWKVVADILPDHLERRKALQKENLANWA